MTTMKPRSKRGNKKNGYDTPKQNKRYLKSPRPSAWQPPTQGKYQPSGCSANQSTGQKCLPVAEHPRCQQAKIPVLNRTCGGTRGQNPCPEAWDMRCCSKDLGQSQLCED